LPEPQLGPGATTLRRKEEDMSATATESRNSNQTQDVRQQIQDLEKAMEVQAATNAGAHATQAATHAGTWSTMIAGAAGFIVGMFLALALRASRP
jgi:hypothetical protein